MRRVDINRKYRMVAFFCAMHGGKDGTRAIIPWETLQEKTLQLDQEICDAIKMKYQRL